MHAVGLVRPLVSNGLLLTMMLLFFIIIQTLQIRKNIFCAGIIKFIDAFNDEFKERTYVNYIEGEYKVEEFIKVARPLCNEPEGGKRCDVCFELRLEETGRIASGLGMDYFATAMAVSPHKDYASILRIGESIGASNNIKFLDVDFKKKNGFGRSIELSKKYGLYRQKFCGCEYARAMMKSR